jgi:hypothetical protein
MIGRRRELRDVWRLTPLVAVATAISLLVSGLFIVYTGEQTYRVEKAEEVRVQARILAETVVAALTFDDRTAAATYVRALEANPQIETAAVYDANGAVFALYRRAREAPPETAPESGVSIASDRIAVTTTVRQDRAELGRVYVRSMLEPLARRYQRYAVIGLLVVMAALVTAVLGIAQTALARTNRRLAEAKAS